jgi:non-ribosomal peptide synthetase component E (peptide arylation enzyme)
MPTLYHGRAILGYRGRFDPQRAFYLLEKYAVRNAFLFPTALKMMMKACPRPRERYDVNLRSIMSAGEAVGTAVFEWAREALGVTINEMFGQTEMNYIVGNSHTQWPARPGSMGRPYPGHRIALIDDAGNEVADGVQGELLTRGPYTIRGYYDAAQKNREAFTADGFYRMGDIVRKQGRHVFTEGRRKDLINRGGEKVSCEEVENLIYMHPAVKVVTLVAMPDPVFGEKACAFVIPKPGATLTFEALVAFLKAQRIASFKLPERLEVVESLPLSPVGKILKRELRDMITAKLAREAQERQQ